MPAALIKSYAKKLDKTTSEVEKVWNDAKNQSEKEGITEKDAKFWPYTVSIFKSMLGVKSMKESLLSFNEFMMNEGLSLSQKNRLKELFVKSIDKVDSELSIKDFADIVADIVVNEFGSHNVPKFDAEFKLQAARSSTSSEKSE